ncbi:MAG TPA: peptidoglycan-binding protein LysM [Flavobacterium sp.]|nr:peptidoglycan-binding protein LysM [Flavobacterium sp.]
MIKKWTYFASLTIIITFLSSGFKPFSPEDNEWFRTSEEEEMDYMFPSPKPEDYKTLNIPFTGKFFVGYKEAIAFKESQGRYKLVNSLGYMGKYQFGREALKAIGIFDTTRFLNSPALQERAFIALLQKNKWELREEIKKYEGKIIAGVKITESGILAAAHLGGAGSVKKFFKSNGKRYIRDNFGTSLRSFMRNYGGYDTSGIIADSDVRVK